MTATFIAIKRSLCHPHWILLPASLEYLLFIWLHDGTLQYPMAVGGFSAL
jgi:hypothetical protein